MHTPTPTHTHTHTHTHTERSDRWSSCHDPSRVLLVPYVANSKLTQDRSRGAAPMAERTISVFGSFSPRNRPMRVKLCNLDWPSVGGRVECGNFANNNLSQYMLHAKGNQQKKENQGIDVDVASQQYSERLASARFCLHVVGDSPTSRRLFDAVAALCIPIIISDHMRTHLPFSRSIPWVNKSIYVAYVCYNMIAYVVYVCGVCVCVCVCARLCFCA